jgi:hypothetical protein
VNQQFELMYDKTLIFKKIKSRQDNAFHLISGRKILE